MGLRVSPNGFIGSDSFAKYFEVVIKTRFSPLLVVGCSVILL